MSKHGKERRPNRIIDITDENVAKLPMEAVGGSDIYYDRTDTDFSVMIRRRGVREYQLRMDRLRREACGITANTPYVNLGKFATVAEAREAYVTTRDEVLRKVEEFTKTNVGSVMRRHKKNSPETSLEDRPDEIDPKYEPLLTVLMDALHYAASEGQGRKRHFVDHDIMQVMDRVGVNYGLGEAIKNILATKHVGSGWRNALLGAIISLSAAIVWRDLQHEDKANGADTDRTDAEETTE